MPLCVPHPNASTRVLSGAFCAGTVNAKIGSWARRAAWLPCRDTFRAVNSVRRLEMMALRG